MDDVEVELQRLLQGDRDARQRAAAALRERKFDLVRLAPVLAHPHVSRRVKAIEILHAFPTRESVELLVPGLASPNHLIANKTIIALGAVGAAAPDIVVLALDDPSEE